MRCRYLARVLVFVIPFLLLCTYANAAEVRALKGDRMLIQLQGSQFNVGDIIKIQNEMGETRALGKVIKVAGRFAEAIFRGHPQIGYSVVIFPKRALERKLRQIRNRQGEMSGGGSSYSPSGPSHTSYGVLAGYNSATATVKLNNGDSVSLKGSGLSLMGFMDHPFRDWFSFRGEAGIDQLNLSGATDTGCSGACNAKINYLSLDLLARFTHRKWHGVWWGGAGVNVLFPLTKSSTALASSSISGTMTYVLAVGYDLQMHRPGNPYIPIQIQYQLFPNSATVTAHTIEFDIGYGKTF